MQHGITEHIWNGPFLGTKQWICQALWSLWYKMRASRGDGIPAELFKMLKDDVVKVLHSTCQQIWKTQQWPQDWKRSVFIPTQRRAMPKNVLLLLSHYSRVQLCATPLTEAHQAPPSLGFSRQEHWSGLPFPSPNYPIIVLISHGSKGMFKILQARLQQYGNENFQMYQLGLEKAEEPEIKLPTFAGS